MNIKLFTVKRLNPVEKNLKSNNKLVEKEKKIKKINILIDFYYLAPVSILMFHSLLYFRTILYLI